MPQSVHSGAPISAELVHQVLCEPICTNFPIGAWSVHSTACGFMCSEIRAPIHTNKTNHAEGGGRTLSQVRRNSFGTLPPRPPAALRRKIVKNLPNHERLLHKEEDGKFFSQQRARARGPRIVKFYLWCMLETSCGTQKSWYPRIGTNQAPAHRRMHTHEKHSSPQTQRPPTYGTIQSTQRQQQALFEFPAHTTPSVSGGKVAAMSPYTMHGHQILSTDISSRRVGRGNRVKLRRKKHTSTSMIYVRFTRTPLYSETLRMTVVSGGLTLHNACMEP